jgi:putative transposase
MKFTRSVKLHFSFATQEKRRQIQHLINDYADLVNCYIDCFWSENYSKKDLVKTVLDKVPHSYFCQRLKQQAAREALDMIKSAKTLSQNTGKLLVKPKHYGKRMALSSACVSLSKGKAASYFDMWLSLRNIGNKLKLDIPVKLHRQYHKWNSLGRLMGSFVIFNNCVQLSFEVEVAKKKPITNCIGIDTGINALASLSTGEQTGKDLKRLINTVKRRKKGSKGKARAIKTLRDYIALTAKRIVMSDVSLIVIEDLKGITHGTKPKGRLSKNMRSVIGSWNVRYWFERLEMLCEENRVSLRRVKPYDTSRTCPSCGLVDKKNRNGEIFMCQNCGHTDNADVNAAINILNRFSSGLYGAGYKATPILSDTIG